LIKVRDESDRHHALDAVVIAACTHGMVKRMSDYARRKELDQVAEGFVDIETGEIINPAMFQQLHEHFPDPWPHFRDEVQMRLKIDDPAQLRSDLLRLGNYAEEDTQSVRPLFVSRAVAKRGVGEIHSATLHRIKPSSPKSAFVKVPLEKLTPAKLEAMVGRNDPRNFPLYSLLKARLAAHGDDPKKAFGPQQPRIEKPVASGKTSPVVRSIRIEETQNTGLIVRGGIADLGDMKSVGVYQREKGYVLIPEYTANSQQRRSPLDLPEGTVWRFSLTKNDLLEIQIDDETTRGYFVMYESDGRLTLRAHDQPQPDKKYFRKSVAAAKRISKLYVDALGRVYLPQSGAVSGLA
jgi:CRISPR-associated endonuclease Csn1